MARLLLFIFLNLLYLQAVAAKAYQVAITTGFYGPTEDKVRIILVGQGGAQTNQHELKGPFTRNSVKFFGIFDRDVGTVSAVKLQLSKEGQYKDFWYLEQVVVITSGKTVVFSYKGEVKYAPEWTTIWSKCRRGYKKLSDGTCVDIDECKDSGGCPNKIATCHNTPGSFACLCPHGYTTDYQNRCQDVDECRKGQNWGGCEERCVNTAGSYRCECYRSGYRLVQGYRCVDIDECQEGKDNCDKATTVCRNYPGGFTCRCKQGHSWKDSSSCERVKCQPFSPGRDSRGTLTPARCFQKGQNRYQDNCTVVCNHGYIPATPSAVTTTCGQYRYWIPSPSFCTGRPCPKLVDIANGYVQSTCRSETKRYGNRCQYWCGSGYALKGSYFRECQADGTWSSTEPTCEKVHPKPWISCPSSITVVLKPGMSTSDVGDKWKRPSSNVNNITAVSPPGVSRSYQFPAGTTLVKWVAVNEIGEHKHCFVAVYIEDNEKPKVVFCPKKIYKVHYKAGSVWVNITKPVFTDNVGIASYQPQLIDGAYLSHGRDYRFTASDANGNSAECKFKVILGGYRCQVPPEGPPDGSWQCNAFGGGHWCVRQCAPGEKPFGASVTWMCHVNVDGKWKRLPPGGQPVTHCVGYKDVNASVPCAVGSIRNTSFGFEGCYKCPTGTFYNNGNCEACTEGKFQDQTGQTSCKSCPAGTFSLKGSWICRPICPPGRYSENGLGPFCKFCSNGTYQDKAQQTSCLQCPKGTYTLHIGATFCGRSPQIAKVEPGNVSSVSAGGTVVLKCFSQGEPTPSVYWQYPANGKGSKTQEQMKDKDGKPTGTQLTLTNADLSDGGSYTCVSANTHGEITRSVQLTVTKASSKRMTVTDIEMEITMDDVAPRAAQDQCPAGKFSSDGLGPLCRVCPKNSYQDQPGMTACKNCASGTETLQLAATSQEDCGAAPVITSVNSSVNSTSKEATLDCYAHASPSPLVTWRLTEDIPSDFLGIPKFVQLVDEKGKPIGTRMIIVAVTRYNTGQYECKAVNPHGQDKKTLDLIV